VPAHVLATNEPVRVKRASDGTLEVMLPAGLPITRPVAELLTSAIDFAWSQDVHGSDTAQLPHAQSRQPDDGDDPLPAGGDRRDTATMPGRVRELVCRSQVGSRPSRQSIAPRTTAAEADPPPEIQTNRWSIRQLPLGLGMVTATLLVSTLFADSGTDDDLGDGHFGMVADELQPPPTLAIYAKPRDDYNVPTGS